LIYIIYINVY